jgi:hypothetical protein
MQYINVILMIHKVITKMYQDNNQQVFLISIIYLKNIF